METETKLERVRSAREVADALGIGLSTLKRLEARGELPPRTQITERRYGWTDTAIRQFILARST